jgi:hypothetical protein
VSLGKRFPTFPCDALVASPRIKTPNKTVIVFFEMWIIQGEATVSSRNIRNQLPTDATSHPRRMDTSGSISS